MIKAHTRPMKPRDPFIISSCPMIGMPRKDSGGAIKLFQQHRAGQHMRPGGGTEGEQQVGRGALGIGMPVRRAPSGARAARDGIEERARGDG